MLLFLVPNCFCLSGKNKEDLSTLIKKEMNQKNVEEDPIGLALRIADLENQHGAGMTAVENVLQKANREYGSNSFLVENLLDHFK